MRGESLRYRGMTDLEKAIWRTICWFAIFEYPLTAFEIWKWLWSPGQKYSLLDVTQVLSESSWLDNRLQTKWGFYARRANQSIAEMMTGRQSNFLDSVRKYKKLRKIIGLMSLVPGVRAIAAVNTMSWWQTNTQSDIDLFIIVKPGTIWLTRLLVVTPFALLKKRPGASNQRDPFCFTFFVSELAVGLKKMCVPGFDPYMNYWVGAVVPVYSQEKQWQHYYQTNEWVRENLPNIYPRAPHSQLVSNGWFKWPWSFAFLDNLARGVQNKRFPEKIMRMKNQDTRVVINNDVLKFHVDDPRQDFKRRWQELINYEA